MEILLFTLVGAILYVTADGIVKAIEKRKGELLKNRSIVFFGIITLLALVTFNLLQRFGPELGLLPSVPVDEAISPTQTPKS